MKRKSARKASGAGDQRVEPIRTLPHTLGLGPEVWRVLDKCHSVRNLGKNPAHWMLIATSS